MRIENQKRKRNRKASRSGREAINQRFFVVFSKIFIFRQKKKIRFWGITCELVTAARATTQKSLLSFSFLISGLSLPFSLRLSRGLRPKKMGRERIPEFKKKKRLSPRPDLDSQPILCLPFRALEA